MTKFGILFKPTDEFVSWYNQTKGKNVLFDDNQTTVKAALFDVLYADGGYDGDINDFVIETVEVANEYDGSERISNDNIDFVQASIFKANETEENTTDDSDKEKTKESIEHSNSVNSPEFSCDIANGEFIINEI